MGVEDPHESTLHFNLQQLGEKACQFIRKGEKVKKTATEMCFRDTILTPFSFLWIK